MDIFDQYLFDEIVKEYNRTDLSSEDYEEIYQRLLNLEHVTESKPYLLTMKFLGLGTEAKQDEVLAELKSCLGARDVILSGLYYDLTLLNNREDRESEDAFLDFVKNGYTDIYLKKQSHIHFYLKPVENLNFGYTRFVVPNWDSLNCCLYNNEIDQLFIAINGVTQYG